MNIVLTGYMGTGKTSVASELKNILGAGWEVLDTDDLIVKKEGRTINDIFAQNGEPYFRDVEAKVIEEVSNLDNKIISTGGGAVLRAENIENLKKNGMVVCLTASSEKIFERLKKDDTRPLLKVENPLAKIKEMLESRKPFYENNNYAIDTTDLTVEEIAEKIIYLKDSIRVELKENSYNLFVVRKPIIDSIIDIVKLLLELKTKNILIVTDSNSSKFINMESLQNALQSVVYSVAVHTIPAGEEHKNLDEINKIWKSCIDHGLDRGSLIIALGGGVVGDMAGFAAATYLRGINFIQIPTTLLAQVDASIGGKTGIDLPFGKNLVGAFHQPKLVLTDPKFLKTLDDKEYKNGLAEVIKYGVIYGDYSQKEVNFFVFLEENIEKIIARDDSKFENINIFSQMVSVCVSIKAAVVSADEKEGNLRKILNFGHTLGHAVETYQKYSDLKHGEAVALGMAFAAYVAVEMGICEKLVETRLLNLLNKTGFEIAKWKVEIFKSDTVCDEVISFMAHDKKMSAGKVDFILPENLGKVKIVPLELEFIKKMLISWGKNNG